ncbi:hypothetical protein Bca4012_094559 [Brassica carinata]
MSDSGGSPTSSPPAPPADSAPPPETSPPPPADSSPPPPSDPQPSPPPPDSLLPPLPSLLPPLTATPPPTFNPPPADSNNSPPPPTSTNTPSPPANSDTPPAPPNESNNPPPSPDVQSPPPPPSSSSTNPETPPPESPPAPPSEPTHSPPAPPSDPTNSPPIQPSPPAYSPPPSSLLAPHKPNGGSGRPVVSPSVPSRETPSTNSSNGNQTMVGMAVAGVAIMALIAIVFLVRRKKKRNIDAYAHSQYLPHPNFSVKSDGFSYGQDPSKIYSGPGGSMYNSQQQQQYSSMGNSYGSQRGQSNDSAILGTGQTHFSYEELAEITQGFARHNILGEGGFGCVYKGTLHDGKVVAVKQLKAGSGQGDREFKAEVEIISRVHHRHLVSLVADFGLARLNDTTQTHVSTRARPLLLKAIETGDFSELIDRRLEKYYVEHEVFRMIETAAACVRHSGPKRPRMVQVVRALDCDEESGDISNGIKVGQSTTYNSGQYNQDITKFRKMAFGSGDSGEAGMYSGDHSVISSSDFSGNESETRPFNNRRF